jgi:hypothetical protein
VVEEMVGKCKEVATNGNGFGIVTTLALGS